MAKEWRRGEKQLAALEIMNRHFLDEDYRLDDVSKEIGEVCFGDESELSETDIENRSRHLMRYIVKYQDRTVPHGKKKSTFRDQGWIIEENDWYKLVPNPENVTDTAGRHVLYKDFPLKKPTFRKERMKIVKPAATPIMDKDRLNLFRKSSQNIKAKEAARSMIEMARAGLHRFSTPPTVTPLPAPAPGLVATSEKADAE